MSMIKVISTMDRNGKGMDNTFPSDRAVGGTSPHAVGTTLTTFNFDPEDSNEVICEIEGDVGTYVAMHLGYGDVSMASGIRFSSGLILSIPNDNIPLRVIGDHASIKLRMFYSAGYK